MPSGAVMQSYTSPNIPTRLYVTYAAACYPAVASQVHGFLSNPTSQAQSYWFLGTAALGTALLLLTMPRQVATVMLNGHPDGVVETLVRAAGATLVSTAAVKYTLKVSKACSARRAQRQQQQQPWGSASVSLPPSYWMCTDPGRVQLGDQVAWCGQCQSCLVEPHIWCISHRLLQMTNAHNHPSILQRMSTTCLGAIHYASSLSSFCTLSLHTVSAHRPRRRRLCVVSCTWTHSGGSTWAWCCRQESHWWWQHRQSASGTHCSQVICSFRFQNFRLSACLPVQC